MKAGVETKESLMRLERCLRRWRETPTPQVTASHHHAGETTFRQVSATPTPHGVTPPVVQFEAWMPTVP